MKICNIVDKSSKGMSDILPLAQDLVGYIHKKVGFNRPVGLTLQSDIENSKNILGKTAHYEPDTHKIAIYVDGRHPKDILRSVAHELIHHAQNCRGEFDSTMPTEPGYAQKDDHLRNMEREAYEQGNLCFRDWEDSKKTQLQEIRRRKMSSKSDKLKKMIHEVILEDLGHEFLDEIHSEEATNESSELEEEEVQENQPHSVGYRETLEKSLEEAIRNSLGEAGMAKLPGEKTSAVAAAALRAPTTQVSESEELEETEGLEEDADVQEEGRPPRRRVARTQQEQHTKEWWNSTVFESLKQKWAK